MAESDIGLFGLAVMGQNFALNMAEHGFTVSVANRSPAKVIPWKSNFCVLLPELTRARPIRSSDRPCVRV